MAYIPNTSHPQNIKRERKKKKRRKKKQSPKKDLSRCRVGASAGAGDRQLDNARRRQRFDLDEDKGSEKGDGFLSGHCAADFS